MKKIEFKNFKGYFNVEEYNNGEEQDRVKIYDENNHYVDYINTEDITEEQYNSELELLENIKTAEEFFDYFCQSYDFGESPQEIMYTYCDDILIGNGDEETKEERKAITADIENMTNEQLCEEYDINKIGDMYFRGNW